ncbi:sensor histidine kinase [Arthrobacter sp. NPDC055585]
METIAGSARSALVDAQRVIEGAEDDGLRTPQPQLEDITGLIDGMRSSLDIDEGTSGEPRELSSGQQLAVFRIVQERLTNVLKHGGRGTAVRLHFDWNGPGLTLLAVSDLTEHPRTPEGTQEQRPGRGIPGMQERAHLAGGWLTALPDGEQFRVTLFLPYGAADNRPGARIVPEGAKSVAGSGETTGRH